MTFYDRDVEVFDLRASLNVVGAGAYRNNLEQWFDSFEGPLGFELHNLRIALGEPTALLSLPGPHHGRTAGRPHLGLLGSRHHRLRTTRRRVARNPRAHLGTCGDVAPARAPYGLSPITKYSFSSKVMAAS